MFVHQSKKPKLSSNSGNCLDKNAPEEGKVDGFPCSTDKKFTRRLKFPVGLSTNADYDCVVYVSSYQNIKDISSATFEVVKYVNGEEKFNVSLKLDEIIWLAKRDFTNNPLKENEKMEYSEKQLSVTGHVSDVGWSYIKLSKMTSDKERQICIGTGSYWKLKICLERIIVISNFMLHAITDMKKDHCFTAELASLFFASLVKRSDLPILDPISFFNEKKWEEKFQLVAPLFGAHQRLNAYLVEPSMTNGILFGSGVSTPHENLWTAVVKILSYINI